MLWGAQVVGTIAIAGTIYFFLAHSPALIRVDPEWTRQGFIGILAMSLPALWYLRTFKRALDADLAASRARNATPDPALRSDLLRKLSIGGALCELPLALGVIYLLAGGEKRWFIGAACITLALRLSYRPFTMSRP